MNLRKRFELFCYRHRNIGIPNLMMYFCIASGAVLLFTVFSRNPVLYETLCFDRTKILQGEVWRLFSYPFTFSTDYLILTLLLLTTYTSLGKAMENIWGVLRFNLYYLSGIVLTDIFCMIFGFEATANHLNLTLFLAYATMYPDEHFLVMFIIPIKARWLAMVDLGIKFGSFLLLTLIGAIPYNLFPLLSLLNYFLFCGKDIVNVFPVSWRANFRRLFRKKKKQKAPGKPIPFPAAGSYEASTASVKGPYHHRCTVCGRTDASDPDLEFRYCSRCNGYHCYCIDHINNHEHIQ